MGVHSRILALIVPLVFLAGCQTQMEQPRTQDTRTPLAARPVITGFEGMPWGSSKDEVYRRFGPHSPEQSVLFRTSGPGPTAWVYDAPEILGWRTVKMFSFDHDERLASGTYIVAPAKYACGRTYLAMQQILAEQFLMLQPQVYGSRAEEQICLGSGPSGSSTTWMDEAAGASITLMVVSGKIWIGYAHAAGLKALNAENARQEEILRYGTPAEQERRREEARRTFSDMPR